jgi:hypothetical protein
MPEDTEPMPFGDRRQHRKLFRFDPTISTGTILEIAVIVGGLFAAWGTYQADRTAWRMEIEQIKSSAIIEKAAGKESIKEIKDDLKDVQKTMTSIDKTLATMQAERAAANAKGQK